MTSCVATPQLALPGPLYIYVYIHVYTHVCTHTYTYIYIYAYICVSLPVVIRQFEV